MPWPTPEYEQQLTDRLRYERRVGFDQATDRSRAARDSSGVRPDLSHSHLLDGQAAAGPALLMAMRAHRNWALRYAPWLLEEENHA